MARLTKQVIKRKSAVRRAYEKAETSVMAAVGRRAVRSKVNTVKKVTRRAAKAGLLAGTVAAASVVLKEVRKRRV
ncbi:MAG TPA: hypothetical protein VGQ73_06675 [Gemmatimonadales bacterium]|jgi:hypothetical protein|nr:hypothetical protein [Gemmatimonadales bacterium]